MTGSVLDILIYVFDRYMLSDAPEVPDREALAEDLERAGFAEANVERALDWLADLANERHRPELAEGDEAPADATAEDPAPGVDAPPAIEVAAMAPTALRVFSPAELERLPADCRGYLYTLERMGILDARQREIVIERLMALEQDELDVEQLKWVVLMVLSSQPGGELACARMEHLVFDSAERPH